jgi:hypothetical protein
MNKEKNLVISILLNKLYYFFGLLYIKIYETIEVISDIAPSRPLAIYHSAPYFTFSTSAPFVSATIKCGRFLVSKCHVHPKPGCNRKQRL